MTWSRSGGNARAGRDAAHHARGREPFQAGNLPRHQRSLPPGRVAFGDRSARLARMQSPAPSFRHRARRWLFRGGVALLALTLWLEAAETPAGNTLDWRAQDNTVDARIEGWPLRKLLEQVAARTHWQVYVEPGAQHVVSAKFRNLKPGDALRRLLGNLNFVLLPSDHGSARLYVFHDSQAGATQLIQAPDEAGEGGAGTGAQRNELIVTLKPDAKESIDDLAKRLGARVVGRLDGLHAYRLRFEDGASADAARSALAQDDDVSSVEDNLGIPRPEVPQLQAGGSLPAFTLRPRAVSDGSQIVIGLVDTPVQTQGTVLKDFLLPAISVTGQAEPPAGELSHGSAMAQTILYALAKSPDAASGTPVRILPVDVYGAASSTSTFQLAQGIYEAINAGAPIINLSLGGEHDSPLLRNVIQAGHAQGVVFLAAPGNEPVTTPTYPAAYPEVIAVTATGRDGQIAGYANRGDFIDAAAPGTSVVPFEGRSYVVTGTSTATANASAYAAAFMAASGRNGSQVEAQVRQSLGVKPPGGKR